MSFFLIKTFQQLPLDMCAVGPEGTFCHFISKFAVDCCLQVFFYLTKNSINLYLKYLKKYFYFCFSFQMNLLLLPHTPGLLAQDDIATTYQSEKTLKKNRF